VVIRRRKKRAHIFYYEAENARSVQFVKIIIWSLIRE